MEANQEKSSMTSHESNSSTYIADADITFTSEAEFNYAVKARKLSRKDQSQESLPSKPAVMNIDKEAVVRKLRESKLFQKSSNYMELKNFVRNSKKSTGMNPDRIEEEIKIVKSSTNNCKNNREKEQEFDEEYGVGFTILKRTGFKCGMGLGKNEQGDPNILQVKNTTVLGLESGTMLVQSWCCNNCQYMNENYQLNCSKCTAERSFYEKAVDIDY